MELMETLKARRLLINLELDKMLNVGEQPRLKNAMRHLPLVDFVHVGQGGEEFTPRLGVEAADRPLQPKASAQDAPEGDLGIAW